MYENRFCIACNKALRGRTDKKFCDDYCRNNYNNKLKATENNKVRNTINALRKNRNILLSLLGKVEKIKVHKEKLSQNNFQWKYHTHIYDNRKGGIYYYCFDVGYLALDNDWYLLVKTKEE